MVASLPPPERPLSYVERLAARDPASVDLLVIHCTELPDLGEARRYGEMIHYPDSGTGNCGHCYVDRDGTTELWAPLDRVAHHVRGHNERSVGIELVNRGRYPDWFHPRRQEAFEPYPEPQVAALLRLTAWLRSQLPALARIAGHEDLDRERVATPGDPRTTVARKRDPGPTFPWTRVLRESGLRRFP